MNEGSEFLGSIPKWAVAEEGRLPLRIEDVDAAWLTEVMSEYAPGIVVDDAQVVDVRHGFTTVLRVRVDVNDVGRDAGVGPTIIVKGGFEEHSASRARTYAMEALAYRDVWPKLGLNVPKCFFADVEPERHQTMVIMEDLLLRGVEFCNPFDPHDLEQATKYMTALAALHAKTWDSPDVKPGGYWESTSRFDFESHRWVGISNNACKMLQDYMNTFDYFTPKVWNRFLELPRNAAVSRHLLDLDFAIAALAHGAELMEVLPQCIVHGDMHLGNLYWDADGTPGFFDFAPRIEPPHLEVGYYLTNCLDPYDRRKWERSLVQHYLDELARHGVDAPDVDEMLHYAFGIFLIWPLIVFIINENVYQTEAFNTVHAMRHSVAMMDHDAKDVILASIDHDPYLSESSPS